MDRRTTLALALCVPLLASPHLLSAQEPQRLKVDLTRPNRTIGTLPFDEPIQLIGVVPAYVDTVTPYRAPVSGLADRKCLLVDAVQPADQPLAGMAAADRRAGAMTRAGQTWTRPDPARPDTMVPDTFDLILHPLRPERNYLLCLRTAGSIPDTMLARIHRRAVAKVDTTLRAIPLENGEYRGLKPAEAQEILARFRTIASELKARLPEHQRLTFSPTSIFLDTTADTTRIKALLGMRAPLNDRATAILNLGSTGDSLHARLRDLGTRHAASLRRLVGSVSAADTVAGWQAASAPGMLNAIRFLLRTAREDTESVAGEALKRVSIGLASASDSSLVVQDTAALLESVWTAEQGAAYLGRVQATRQSLEGIRSLASAVALSEAAQRRTGLTREQALSLRSALDSVSLELFALNRDARTLQKSIVDRDRAVLATVKTLAVASDEQVPVLASSVAVDFNTRSKRYISPDLGVAYAPGFGEAVPYLGVTFFPLGLNKNVVQRGFRPWHSTVGLMLGLTATSVAKANERKDLFGSSSLLFGGTVRFLDVFRASAGGLALRQQNPETLSSDAPVRVTSFGALSFDLDVKSLFGGISSILSGGR